MTQRALPLLAVLPSFGLAVVWVAVVWVVAPAAAQDHHAYRGPHPVDLEGTWHEDDAVHVHATLTVGEAPFGDVGGVRLFLADPGAYGYRGRVYTYRGAHPLPGGLTGYCGLDGEHAHAFAPEGGAYRRSDDGVYAYAGALRGGHPMVRPGQMVPAEPVIVADDARVGGSLPPAWFGGCLHERQVGSGAWMPLYGCIPRGRIERVRPPPVGSPVPAPPSPAQRPTFTTRPVAAPDRGPVVRQR